MFQAPFKRNGNEGGASGNKLRGAAEPLAPSSDVGSSAVRVEALENAISKKSDRIRRHLLFARSVGAVSMAVGAFTLVGWAFDIAVLRSVLPAFVPMFPNPAICFILLGVALWLSPKRSAQSKSADLKRQVVAQGCALFSALLGVVTLSQDLFGFNAGIDMLLFRKEILELLATKDANPGRMPQISALVFVLLGVALALLNAKSRRGQRVAQTLALVGFAFGLLPLVGYGYYAQEIYRASFLSASLHGSLLFPALGVAILCVRPDHGFISTVISSNLGGALARQILPVTLTLPFLLGWLWLQAERAGRYEFEFGLAMFTTANVLIFSALVWFGSRSLNMADAERQRVSVKIKVSNERLRTQARLLDLAHDAIFIADQNDRITFWNLGAKQLYGWRREEAVGKQTHTFLQTIFPGPLEEIKAILRKEGHWEGELEQATRDGSRIIVSSHWSLHRDEHGNPVGFLEDNNDITERKRAEEALREREGELREAQRLAKVGNWKLVGETVTWSEELHRILGRDPMLAPPAFSEQAEIFTPESWARLQGVIKRATESGKLFELDLEIVCPDGAHKWINTHGEIIRDEEGRIIALRGTAQDITERKCAEEEILRLNAELERRVIARTAQLQATNATLQTEITDRKRIEHVLDDKNIALQDAAETKDRFLATMSHELRTPLNGVIGFAQFLIDGRPGTINPKQKEYLGDILNSGNHLLDLINDILDLAKVEAGKMELHMERFSLRNIIEEVCAAAKPIADMKRIHVEVDVAPELGDVTLDRRRFKQILYNLFSNAVKFNRDDGKVEILVAPNGAHRFKLVVKDTGIGIKVEDVGRLFKEFEQLDSSASRRFEGTGLGLAVTQKIVEMQGGTIGVESEIGKGSSFTVVLPLVMTKVHV